MEEKEELYNEERDTHKYLCAITASTIRDLLKKANDKCIQHEDVVTILKETDWFLLIYYKQ
jgi:hypothetical protein